MCSRTLSASSPGSKLLHHRSPLHIPLAFIHEFPVCLLCLWRHRATSKRALLLPSTPVEDCETGTPTGIAVMPVSVVSPIAGHIITSRAAKSASEQGPMLGQANVSPVGSSRPDTEELPDHYNSAPLLVAKKGERMI